MHLSSLYIDGYGPFEDSLISEFTEGLNLVLVEDEPAAVALRDFIWSMIFGFENGDDGIDILEVPSRESPNRRSSGGFLGFESPDGPVTVSRYRRTGAASSGDASNGERGLVTITGPVGSLDEIIGEIDPQKFRRLLEIDAREITAFRGVIRRQIAETFAERAREAAEVEAVLREAAGQIDVPTIEEIMDEMRIARDYQVARSDNLARSVKGVGRRLRGSRKRAARLKILDRVRPTWNTMLEMQRQMDDLPRLPYLAEDPIVRLEAVSAARAEAQAQLDAARATERTKSSELDGLRPSEEEAARHREIHELAAVREGHAKQLEAIAEAEKEFRGAEASLESELSEIGAEWSADRVREFAATVDPADIRQHEAAIQQAADALDSAEQNNTVAIDADAETSAEEAAMQAALKQLGDLPADEESDLAERQGGLRSLKATVLAIAGKKNVIADLQVKRSDARRLGSGMSRIVMQAQSIVSAAFLFVGLIVWGVAKITSDTPVQKTGLVMMGAGVTGVIFAAMFLWLQRHPTFGRSVLRKNELLKEDQQLADSPGRNVVGAREWSPPALLKTAANALTSVVRWPAAYARALGKKEADTSGRTAIEDDSSKPVESTGPTSDAADHADPLAALADEIGAEGDDPKSEVDEEKASAAMDKAEASIPQELREAQERNEGEKGRIGNLLARVLKFGDETEDKSGGETLGEMSRDGIWSASGQKRRPFAKRLVSSLLAVMTRSRSASQPNSRDIEDDDENAGEASAEAPLEAPAETTEKESSEMTGEAEAEDEPAADDVASEAEDEPAADDVASEAQEEPESEIGEPEEVTAEPESADEPSDESTDESANATVGEPEEIAAEAEGAVEPEIAVEEPPIAEVVADETMCEFGDPIEALDEALAAATRELAALAVEFERLSAQYVESLGLQADDSRPRMTVELIQHAALKTERQIATMREAAEIRSKLAGLEEKREGTEAAVAQAEEQLREATAATGRVRDQWVQWLSDAGVAADLDPIGVRKISEALDPVRVRISAVEILREKLDGLQARAGELEARVRQVPDVSQHDDLAAAFDAIESGSQAANALERKLAGLEETLRSLGERTTEAETEMSRADSLLRATLDEVGAEDESHFRELTEGAAKRRLLADELDRMRIDTPLLTGIDSAGLEEELRAISQEQVEAELAELPGHIERLRSQLASLEHDLTQAETELAGMPEMPGKDVEGAENGNAMPALLRRPLRHSAMQAATRNLERFTAGKYRGLSTMVSEDGGSIVGYKVVDSKGKVDDPEESEAASVFMALRLALIEDYYDRSASVPAAILDVPASDDPEAARAIVSGVLALAETVQVVCISSDPAASGRFAAAAEDGQINLVDAIRLDSPFRRVSGEN